MSAPANEHAQAPLAALPRLALALLLVATAGSAADLNQLMTQLAQRQHARAKFVERQFNSLLDEPLVSSGELRFDAPDHLEKLTLLPKPETLRLDHGVVSFERGKRHLVTSLSDYPALVPLVDSLRAVLAGDRQSLESNFEVQLQSTDTGWSMRLTPRDPTAAALVRRIEVEGTGDALNRISIERHNGDHSEMDITQEPTP